MKEIIEILKWTDPKNEKKLKRKLAPNWMFLAQSILGLGWLIVGFITDTSLMFILGMFLSIISTGAFISRVRDYRLLSTKHNPPL